MFTIAKDFECCYGHRVWSQKLDDTLSNNSPCKCRNLHGHNATIRVTLQSEVLDNQGMVTDFNNLVWFKNVIDNVIDHKFIIDVNDPYLDFMVPKTARLTPFTVNGLEYHKVDLKSVDLPDIQNEVVSGLVLVKFIPTSENIAFWLANSVRRVMHECSAVTFYETPKSQSTFSF